MKYSTVIAMLVMATIAVSQLIVTPEHGIIHLRCWGENPYIGNVIVNNQCIVNMKSGVHIAPFQSSARRLDLNNNLVTNLPGFETRVLRKDDRRLVFYLEKSNWMQISTGENRCTLYNFANSAVFFPDLAKVNGLAISFVYNNLLTPEIGGDEYEVEIIIPEKDLGDPLVEKDLANWNNGENQKQMLLWTSRLNTELVNKTFPKDEARVVRRKLPNNTMTVWVVPGETTNVIAVNNKTKENTDLIAIDNQKPWLLRINLVEKTPQQPGGAIQRKIVSSKAPSPR